MVDVGCFDFGGGAVVHGALDTCGLEMLSAVSD